MFYKAELRMKNACQVSKIKVSSLCASLIHTSPVASRGTCQLLSLSEIPYRWAVM